MGEYGVHWNFFLTLAALQLLGLLMAGAAQSHKLTAALGCAVLTAYQLVLSRGLIDFIHTDDRGSDLLSANKEGLLSLPGYWALQLLSTAGGQLLYRLAVRVQASTPSREHSSSQQTQQAGWQVARALAAGSAAAWVAYKISAHSQPVSRRACNAAYVAWTLALNLQCLALFVVADLVAPGPPPVLLARINQLMLPTFLLANVLTGVVNMSTNTLAAGDWTARTVVAAYAAALGAGVVQLDRVLKKRVSCNTP